MFVRRPCCECLLVSNSENLSLDPGPIFFSPKSRNPRPADPTDVIHVIHSNTLLNCDPTIWHANDVSSFIMQPCLPSTASDLLSFKLPEAGREVCQAKLVRCRTLSVYIPLVCVIFISDYRYLY